MSYAKYKDLGLTNDKHSSSQQPPSQQPPSQQPPSLHYQTQQPPSQQPAIPREQTHIEQPGSYKIQNINDKNNLINSTKLLVVYIWGDFCGPCKQIAPVYETLANKYNSAGNIVLSKEDVKLQITPSVRGVPTFHFYLNSNLVDTIIGADTVSLQNKIIEYTTQI